MIVVVGAGVVGLHVAIALAEARPGDDVIVLEREAHLAAHQSGRNSQILHAGFAYPAGSLKARLCVAGNRLSYAWLERLGVLHARTGKWIVAYDAAEARALDGVLAAASDNGVSDLVRATPAAFARAEPDCHPVVAALWSPSSGACDAAEYVLALARHAAARGVQVLREAGVVAIDAAARRVVTARGELAYDLLVNAAGLWCDEVYRLAGGAREYAVRAFKGEYVTWHASPVRGAIYPVPSRFLPGRAGDGRLVSHMGVHVHRDVRGVVHVGPTQVEVAGDARADYGLVTPRAAFAAWAARYAPLGSPDDLAPGYAGHRAKLFEGGVACPDFVVERTDAAHLHLLGIESPGLTAAPALAQWVVARLAAAS